MAFGRRDKPHSREHGAPIAAVLNEVERLIHAAGGETLPDPCRPRELPDLEADGELAMTCGCGSPQSRVAIPYTDEEDHPQFATLCGVCDSLHKVPRFKPVLK